MLAPLLAAHVAPEDAAGVLREPVLERDRALLRALHAVRRVVVLVVLDRQARELVGRVARDGAEDLPEPERGRGERKQREDCNENREAAGHPSVIGSPPWVP